MANPKTQFRPIESTSYRETTAWFLNEAERAATHPRDYFSGEDGGPQLFELKLDPNLEVTPHAHETDEVIFVLEGELRFGSRVLAAGSAVAIPAYALYGFHAGPEGVRLINFRHTRDTSFIPPDEILAARAAAAEAETAAV